MTSTAARPTRVALLTQGFTSAGGVQTVARWLADGLRTRGLEVTVFDLASTRSDSLSRRITSPLTWRRRPQLVVDRPGHFVRVGAELVELEPSRYLRRASLTRALVDFDVVQVVAGGPALGMAARGSGVPVVLQVATLVRWERDSQLRATSAPLRVWRTWMTGLVSHVEAASLRGASAVLVENEVMLRHVKTAAPGTIVQLAPPGVDVQRFRPSSSGWQRDRPLLSVCRLADPRKGLDRMLDAYALLRRFDQSTPRLVLAGRGQLPAHLRERLRKLELSEHVSVISDVPMERLPDLYRSASIYLQASHEEGLGLSVIEAMACGLPVVATRTAGSEVSVLPGVTGELVDQTEHVVDDFVKAVQLVQRSGPALAVAGRRRAETEFSTDTTIDRFVRMYDLILRELPSSMPGGSNGGDHSGG